MKFPKPDVTKAMKFTKGPDKVPGANGKQPSTGKQVGGRGGNAGRRVGGSRGR